MTGFFKKRQPPAGREKPGSAYSVSNCGRISLHSEGVVFLHLQTGVLFKANRIGARIWEGVLRRDSPETISAAISREYEVPASQVAQDTIGFLAELEAHGFLCRNGGN